jgi:hypothetical protein
MLFDAIIDMAKQSVEVIRNLALLMHVQGKISDDVFHRMVKSANTIQKDALKLEQKHRQIKRNGPTGNRNGNNGNN